MLNHGDCSREPFTAGLVPPAGVLLKLTKSTVLLSAVILQEIGEVELPFFFGLLSGGMRNALIWGLIGLLVGVVASGAVLMVLGWKKGK